MVVEHSFPRHALYSCDRCYPAGHLFVEAHPCDKNGKPLPEDDFCDDPSELVRLPRAMRACDVITTCAVSTVDDGNKS